MRCRAFEEHELTRPAPPIVGELAELIRQKPQQICQVLEPILSEERRARIDQVLRSRLTSIVLVLDHLRDPHNRAAILRTAEALGVQQVHAIEPEGRWPLSRRVT